MQYDVVHPVEDIENVNIVYPWPVLVRVQYELWLGQILLVQAPPQV